MKYIKTLVVLAIAVLTSAAHAAGKPLKVYILAGQSNMQGQSQEWVMPAMKEDPKTRALYDKIMDEKDEFRVIEDVQVAAVSGISADKPVTKNGPLTIGFGGALKGKRGLRGKHSLRWGPELGFGVTIREHVDGPVLLIKASWGGKNLRKDFLSPSGAETMEGAEAGPFYKAMVEHVKTVLADPGKYHPDYNKDAGYEIAGFVWFQGWNDQVAGREKIYQPTKERPAFAVYSDLLAHFIRDVRKDFDAPKMPFVIGVIGTGGKPDSKNAFREAMAAPAAMPEFKGNVFAVHTAKYYDEKLSDLIDRGWRWMKPQWDPEKKYVELAKKLKPLQDELNEAKKIKDKEERKKKTAEIQKQMEEIKYTPEEKAYIEGNKCSQGFHYFGSAKMFGQFGEAFAKALIEGKDQ